MVSVPCSSYRTAVPIWFSSLVTGARPLRRRRPCRLGREGLAPATRLRSATWGCSPCARAGWRSAAAQPAVVFCSRARRGRAPAPRARGGPPAANRARSHAAGGTLGGRWADAAALQLRRSATLALRNTLVARRAPPARPRRGGTRSCASARKRRSAAATREPLRPRAGSRLVGCTAFCPMSAILTPRAPAQP